MSLQLLYIFKVICYVSCYLTMVLLSTFLCMKARQITKLKSINKFVTSFCFFMILYTVSVIGELFISTNNSSYMLIMMLYNICYYSIFLIFGINFRVKHFFRLNLIAIIIFLISIPFFNYMNYPINSIQTFFNLVFASFTIYIFFKERPAHWIEFICIFINYEITNVAYLLYTILIFNDTYFLITTAITMLCASLIYLYVTHSYYKTWKRINAYRN